MELSVIIVSYNVKYYLEQCVQSALKALEKVSGEIIVVDNASTDGSVEFFEKYQDKITFIVSKENLGFSKANNLAMKQAKGCYFLLLNPDTIVPEDCFEKCVAFADAHPDCGGLGVQMIDGKGNFLPESKRGIPLPKVAFYKIAGLSRLFPKNPRFNQYHLGHLSKNEVYQIDILSGAFMFMRKEALDKSGLLDETFFMYGEDIDLSYRLLQAGYKNYYFPNTQIVHYKGESTKKSSVNYVLVFYKAMAIFYKKHFSKKRFSLVSLCIYLAISLRATLALFRRFLQHFFLPVSEAVLLFFAFVALKNYYADTFRFPLGGGFQQWVVQYFFPATIAVILLVSFIGGSYEKPYQLKKSINSAIIGFVIVIVVYALLPEYLRFSRLLVLLNALMGIAIIAVWRILLSLLKLFPLKWNKTEVVAIIAEKNDAEKIVEILSISKAENNRFYFISPKAETRDVEDKDFYIGSFNQLNDLMDIYYVKNLILSKKGLLYKNIITEMEQRKKIDYFTFSENGAAIIGSEELITGELFYNRNEQQLFSKSKSRQKRLFDFSLSLVLTVTYPFQFMFVEEKKRYFGNLMRVLSGKITFVSIFYQNKAISFNKGILSVNHQIKIFNLTESQLEKLNYDYISNYTIAKDLMIVFGNFKKLGD